MAGKINLKGVSGNTFQIGLNGVTLDASAVTTPYTLQLPETLGNVDESIIIGTNGNLEFGHTRKLVGDDSNISIDQDGAIRLAINGQANVISVEGDGTSSNVFFNTTLNLDSPSNLKIGGGLPDYLLVSNGTDLEYRSADSLLVIPQVSKISFDVTVAGDAQSFTSADLLQYVDNTNVLPVVHRNGVYVDDSTYSITGDTITFNHYLRAGECIDILPSQTKVLAGVGDGTVKSISVGGGGLGFSLGGGTITTSGTVSLNVPPATQLANVLANSGLASNQYVVDAITAIPAVDLNGLASTVYVDNKIANVSADLTGYATETFVTNEIANIAIPSITGLATETYVDNAIANVSVDLTGYATETFVTNEIANIAIPSIVGLATETFVDNSINALGNIRTVNLDGNVSNVLSGNGSWVQNKTAGGNTGEIQFNSGGALSGSANLQFGSDAIRIYGNTTAKIAGIREGNVSSPAGFGGFKLRGNVAAPVSVVTNDLGVEVSVQYYTGTGLFTPGFSQVSGYSVGSSFVSYVESLPSVSGNAINSGWKFLVTNDAHLSNNFNRFTALQLKSNMDAVFGGNIYANANVFLGGATNSKIILTTQAPATATSAGTTGQVAFDSDYIYYCVATDTWKRSPLSTW